MSVIISETAYRAEHGRPPSGLRAWQFDTGMREILCAPWPMDYHDARKWAADALAESGDLHSKVQVMP